MWSRLAAVLCDVIMPSKCLACGTLCPEPGAAFCPGCVQGLWPMAPPVCGRCSRPMFGAPGTRRICGRCQVSTPPYDRLVAAYRYGGPMADAIIRGKHGNLPGVFTRLGRELAKVVAQVPLPDRAIVVPVPLHWLRTWQRGYNQSDLLARVVARHIGHGVAQVLVRTKSTGSQRGRDKVARRDALEGAFKVRKGVEIAGETVVLVDDVTTTGATIEACTRALLEGGAARVIAGVLARVDW